MLDWPSRSCPELEMGDVKCTSLPFLLTQCGIEKQNILGLGSSISKIWDFNWVTLNIPISLIVFRFVTSIQNFGFSESICINWTPARDQRGHNDSPVSMPSAHYTPGGPPDSSFSNELVALATGSPDSSSLLLLRAFLSWHLPCFSPHPSTPAPYPWHMAWIPGYFPLPTC